MHAVSQSPVPSLARERRILKPACPESGRGAVTVPDSGVAVEHEQVVEAEQLARGLRRPRPSDSVEEIGETETIVRYVGSSNYEAVGISEREREVLEVVEVEEQVVLSGVVSGPTKGKYWVGVGVVEAAGMDEKGDTQVASRSDLLGPAYSGSAQMVGGEKVERVCATQRNRLRPRWAHIHSNDLLGGDPMSGEGRTAESAEAKR